MNNPIEYSEDRRRGELPHIQRAIDSLVGRRVSCSRCRSEIATHVIDAYHSPRAVCRGCAGVWAGFTPLERCKSRVSFALRGGR